MTIRFSDRELDYIIKEPFNWHVSEEAPKSIKKSANRKLRLLERMDDGIKNRP